MAAQVEVQTGEVGRTVVGGRLHLSPLTDSSNNSLIEMPPISQSHIITPEPNKPVPGPKPRLTPKPFAVERNPTIKPILAPKPQTKPRPEPTRLAGCKPELPCSPKPQQPVATGKPRPVSTNSNRPASTSFKTPSKLNTGQTVKPVVQPFKAVPPLEPGDPSKPTPPVPAERQKAGTSTLAYSKSLKTLPAAEWSGTTKKEEERGQTTSNKGGTITRAKSMGFLVQVGQEEEEKEKAKPVAAVPLRPHPRGSRPRPVSAIFLDSPTKTEKPVPAPRWTGRRPLSADLTSKFESIGLSLHRTTPKANTKENTPDEKSMPQMKEVEKTLKSATPQSTDGVAKPADQSNKKTEEMTVKDADEDKHAGSIKSRISLLLDSSSSPTPGATGQGPDLLSPVQPAPETEPTVGVKQLIKQLTVDTTPTQSPVMKPPLKPRPLPLDLTKRFSSERSPDLGSVSLSEATDRHDISKDPQWRIEESAVTSPKTPVDLKDTLEQLRKASTPEGPEPGQTFAAISKESAVSGDVQTVRASVFENVIERHSVQMVDEGKPVNKAKDSLISPSFKTEEEERNVEEEGTLVTATYKEPLSPSSPLRVIHAFDTVQAAEESRAVSENIPSAQWEDKAMTLRSRRSEGNRPVAERTGEPQAQPRYLRVGALQKWTTAGVSVEKEASTEKGTLKESQREGQVAVEKDSNRQEQEDVAAAPKRLKMLQPEEQPKPRATYFALTGQMQEPVSPVNARASTGDTTMSFEDFPVRSVLGSSQGKVLPVRRNPSLEEAFGKTSQDHVELMMKSQRSQGEIRSALDAQLSEEMMEVEKKGELKKEAERHQAKMKELEREKQRQLEVEAEAHLEFQRMKEREMQREFERQRQKALEKEKQEFEEKQRDLEKQKQLELERQKLQELAKERLEKERQRQIEKEKRRELERQRKMEREKLREQERERQREQERQRQREEERQKELDKERQLLEIQKEKQKVEELERMRELERQQLLEFQKQKQREKERLQLIELEKQRLREKMEREEAEKAKQMAIEQEMLRMRELEKERERQKEMERERQKEIEREKQKQELERQRQRDLERERQRQLELDRERQRQLELERERQRQLELERERQRQLDLERERQRQLDLERERQRQLDLERERQRQLDLDRERQRQLDLERERQRQLDLERERQRQLDIERQELENQRLRQRELEKERQRKEELEMINEMERRQLLEFEKQKQAEKERQQTLELEKRKLREEAEKMRQIAKQQEAERQRLKERQKKEEQERARLESSPLRPKVLDLDSVLRNEPLSKAASPRSDPATRWKEPSLRPEEPYKPAILDIDSFTSQAQPSPSKDLFPFPVIQSVDGCFGGKSQPTPERDITWKVPPQNSVGFTSPVWTTSPQDPWELRPVEMSVDKPPADSRKHANKVSPEQLLLRQDERHQVPQRHWSALLDEPLHPAPLPVTETKSRAFSGGVSSSTPAEQIWIPRELQPQDRGEARSQRRSQGSQELNRMRSRSVSRRSAPSSSAVEGSLSRMRSRSAHREQDRHSWVQQRQNVSGEEEGKDSETLVRDTDSQYGTWETGLRTDDSLTPATPSSESNLSPSPRKPSPPRTPGDHTSQFDTDTLDSLPPLSSSESQLLPFPDASVTLLDTSALRSRAQLGKKRAPRTRPSRAARQSAVLAEGEEGSTEDWLYRDSTEAKAEKKDDESDSEEPARGADISPAVPAQPQRVALFPGMDPSALMAQLKKRGDSDNQIDGSSQSPSQLSRSPKSPFLPRAARVLPPPGGKENGEEDSPQWLKELKSKKRLSQYENES